MTTDKRRTGIYKVFANEMIERCFAVQVLSELLFNPGSASRQEKWLLFLMGGLGWTNF